LTVDITETEVHALLHQRLTQIQGVKLLGWNPPNAKTYGLPNILIPKTVGRRRAGSDRIDACLAYRDVLMLVEIKPASAQTGGDVAKLRRICSRYELGGITQILKRQGITINSSVRWLVPVIAFGVINSELPKDFMCWQAYPDCYQQLLGSELPVDAVDELRELGLSFERRPNSLET
jgi:hypothetical protein